MKKTLRGMVVLVGLTVFGVAQGANWVMLSAQSNVSTYLIDTDSIVKGQNDTVRAWIQERPKVIPMKLSNGVAYDDHKYLTLVYCKTRMNSVGPSYWYLVGNPVFTMGGYSEPSEVIPDSMGEAIWTTLCRPGT
ncbi:surface-adhesin E family protein [Caballeronia concitans]|uniref:Surface-adhesin protein E-like domain-containing protein n=1 Tax=Caballeronia concitans TaxID=1777133 RepID=A0A658R543_9BURK|nr:surface-adhesin E family protein [Caballeronia concitans]SAL51329.1 hypothetical protein AWB72_05429 [Caballeronia concitans]